ncbi:MAG: DivIVA domain-containing protein [Subdoligranulum sp.]|nr:DivIVA domain-containing protein [Subdoligranulum sp.]
MNVEDIHNVTFDRVMRGYKPEEVDEYLDKVAAELERLQAEKADIEKKMYILAEKVDQYRNDEETLKTALLNAQRMGESVIQEARSKAETILYDATNKANLARDEALQKVAEEELLLSRLKAEVAHFKSDILNLYKQHIESLSLLPGEEKKKPEEPKPEAAESEKKEPPAPQPAPKEEPSDEEDPFRSMELPDGVSPLEDYQGISFDD